MIRLTCTGRLSVGVYEQKGAEQQERENGNAKERAGHGWEIKGGTAGQAICEMSGRLHEN